MARIVDLWKNSFYFAVGCRLLLAHSPMQEQYKRTILHYGSKNAHHLVNLFYRYFEFPTVYLDLLVVGIGKWLF